MEQKLFLLINRQWTSPALDRIMATLSSFDFWTPVLLLLIVVVAVFGGFKARALLLTLALSVGIADGVVVNSLKCVFNRPRPCQAQAVRVVKLQKTRPAFFAVIRPANVTASQPESGVIQGRSFPSGHTTDNFTAAMVLAAFYRRRGWLYFPIAAAVGYSRIYTGSHWPSDVFISAFLGCGLGLLGVAAAEAFWRRLGGRIAPALHRDHPSLIQGAVDGNLPS
ncbi:MAG: phosphatase PAP2 family protein [Verrucomicrobiota bacterium]